MDIQDSALMTINEIEVIISKTNKKFKLNESGIVGKFSKRETDGQNFFKQITSAISDGLIKVKLYGKDKIDEVVDSVKSILDTAKNNLKEKFEELLKQIEQFITTLFNEYMNIALSLIPKKIVQDGQGNFVLNSVTFSKTISLQSGIVASITEFFKMVVIGELSFESTYDWKSN